jgi:hypothetical protein
MTVKRDMVTEAQPVLEQMMYFHLIQIYLAKADIGIFMITTQPKLEAVQ